MQNIVYVVYALGRVCMVSMLIAACSNLNMGVNGQAVAFLQLPSEVREEIYAFLPKEDLLSIRQIYKNEKNLIEKRLFSNSFSSKYPLHIIDLTEEKLCFAERYKILHIRYSGPLDKDCLTSLARLKLQSLQLSYDSRDSMNTDKSPFVERQDTITDTFFPIQSLTSLELEYKEEKMVYIFKYVRESEYSPAEISKFKNSYSIRQRSCRSNCIACCKQGLRP
ncbi:F-box protein [Candidatus Cardinium hertigii]|nr:F-box protein [Candidatus Cardinium hertigii]